MDIDIKDFTNISGVELTDNILLALKNGMHGKMTIDLLIKAIVSGVKPSIVNGNWVVGGIDTGVSAEGNTPLLRSSSVGIEWKSENTDWTLLVSYDVLKLKYSDLTEEQKDELKGRAFTFSDFTLAQLEALKGADGTLIFEDLTPEQKESLKGDVGATPEIGANGNWSIKGVDTDLPSRGKAFIHSDFTPEQLANLAFKHADFTTEQLALLKGEKGDGFTYGDFTAEQLEALSFKYSDFTAGELGTLSFKYSDFTDEQLESLKVKGDTGKSFYQMVVGEIEVGTIAYGGKLYPLNQLTIELNNLPITSGESADITLSDYPSNELYLSVESISVLLNNCYYPSAYKIAKIFNDVNGKTIATIKCEETLSASPKVLLTINYVIGLIEFEDIEFTIPIADLSSDMSALDITIPPCKYNKDFALTFATDDSSIGLYQKVFNYIHSRWVDDKHPHHVGDKHTTGIQPTRILSYTDGCDNDIPFRIQSNWMRNASYDCHEDDNQYTPYLWWKEGREIYDYYGDITNHGGSDESKPTESLNLNNQDIITNMGVHPFVMCRPGGNEGFPEASESINYIYSMESAQFKQYPKLSDFTTTSFKPRIGRESLDTNATNASISEILSTKGRDSAWISLFCHSIKNSDIPVNGQLNTDVCFAFLDEVYDTYAKGGADKVWFAGHSEIYEYLFTRINSRIIKVEDGDNIKVQLRLAKLPLFHHKEVTLNISGISTLDNINISNNATFYSSNNTTKMLNISYSQHATLMSEKYVSIYEDNRTDNNKLNAYFFVNKLKDSLKAPFVIRLENIPIPGAVPVLQSISVNAGGESTYDMEVSIKINSEGDHTHYKVGEVSSLESISWIASTITNISYTLTSGYGKKNIYVQLKNANGVSVIKNDSITYSELPAEVHTVTGSSNNSSFGTVLPSTQIVASGGTANLSASANSGYEIKSWSGATSSTGVGTDSGTAVVSNVVTDKTVTCNFVATAPIEPGTFKAIIFLDDPHMTGTITLPNGDKASKVSWAARGDDPNNNIVDTKGNIIGIKWGKELILEDVILNTTISNINPLLTGDAGPYPDQYINRLFGPYSGSTYPEKKGVYRLLELSSGTYNIRILYTTQVDLTQTQIEGLTWEVNGVVTNPPAGFNPLNNANAFVEINNVTVGSDGVLDLYFGSVAPWRQSGVNCIELTKR